jgi:hypothetical protein
MLQYDARGKSVALGRSNPPANFTDGGFPFLL